MKVTKIIVEQLPYGCKECNFFDYEYYQCCIDHTPVSYKEQRIRPNWCPLVDKDTLSNFRNNLIILLFGDDYAERVSPDQLTDEKLLEAVRMLKEVY